MKSGHDMGTVSAYRALTATGPDSTVPTGKNFVPTFGTIILTTLLCAARLFELTACGYLDSTARPSGRLTAPGTGMRAF
jgi:hypothetical protein